MSITSANTNGFAAGVLAGLNRKLSAAAAAHGMPSSAMEVRLDHHYSAKAYTSGSGLSGHVVIRPARDTRFDSLQVLLMGVSQTRLDGVHAPSATQHTFLRLEMPIPDAAYPVPRVYEAGRVYAVPFNFVVPSYLTLSACSHRIESEAVSGHHLCIPPSLGGVPFSSSSSSSSSWDRDDMAPDMARVEYTIRARLYRDEELGKKRTRILEASQAFNVLPAFSEQPPLNITPGDSLYTMSKTKSVRKSILSPKTGKVTLTAAQPGAVMLSPDGSTGTATSARIDLTYESSPSSSSSHSLPKVTEVTSKVSAVTFFGSGAIKDLPNMGNWVRTYGAEGRGSYTYNTSLGTTAVEGVEWRKQPISAAPARRDSGYGSDMAADHSDHSVPSGRRWSSSSSSSKSSASKPSSSPSVCHTASIQVPVQLPTHKRMFVPTFHSCIVSRVYVLWLTVTVASGGGSSSAKTTLGVPLQIGVEPDGGADPAGDGTRPPSFEAAMEEAEAEAFLRPRTLYVPEVEFERHALPGYGDSVGWRTAAAAGA
ncbi:uncharacterized protein PG998_003106 [Apiospora kogelbergensis]|uniref:uncharacterized protein n=1 Tax=Apiospora kogelbergensis TaxID=1337665 RepID=UPI00312E1FE2